MRARMPFAALLPALLLVALLGAKGQAAAEELLANGDFSQNGSGWAARGLDLRFDAACDGHAAAPAAGLNLEEGGEGWFVSDAVPVEPAGTYEASGYVRFVAGSDSSSQMRFVLDFYQTVDGTGDPLREVSPKPLPYSFTDYTLVSTGAATAPGQAHSARLRVQLLSSGTASVCADDFSLTGPRPSPTETPAPTVPAPSATPTTPPTPTASPTPAATEVPMPSASILNGGFEEGVDDSPAVWQKFGGFLSRSTAIPRSGSFAGAFSSDTASTKWVYQALSVDPGRSYAFHGFVLKNGPADSSGLLRISWYTSSDASGSAFAGSDSPESLSGSDPSYRYLSTGSVTAPEDAHSARARVVLVPASGDSETVYLDDFTLEETAPPTPTPEPTLTATPTPSGSATPTPVSAETTLSVPPVLGDRLLNGGFEEGVEGKPAAWQKFGGFLSRSTAIPRSGSFAGAFSSDAASTKWVYQPLSVGPGRSYAFHGFVLKNGPVDSEVLLRISWYTSSDASGSSFAGSDSPESLSGSDPSCRYLSTGSVTAPEDAHSARARVVFVPASAVPETVYLDDFALEETAAPGRTLGMESGEGTPLPEEQTAAIGEPDPPSEPDGTASDGGSRGRTSSATATQFRQARTYEDSPYAVKVSEVLASAGASGDDAGGEWVELYNAGPESVELGGWTRSDNVAADTLPPLTLSPGAYAVVTASAGFRRQYPAFRGSLLVLAAGRIGNGLADDGDRLLLLDEEGRPVDALSYGADHEFFDPPAQAVPPGHSLERFPPNRDTDTAADFHDNAHPSPGVGPAVEASPTATASLISEVQGRALAAIGGGDAPHWPWLLLAAGLVFVGGTGAGAAGVLFWLARGRRL